MSWKPVANSVKSPVISQNGGQFTTITKFGQLKLSLRLILYWNKFKKIVIARRTYQGRSALTSFIIVDAQSVKNTATAENKGYDAGKKISGIKRHLAVDINGFPQAIHMTRANVSDRDGASAMIALHAMHLRQVQNVLVDGGYSGINFGSLSNPVDGSF